MLVTIVIPFYDEIDYLEEAVQSVVDQDLNTFEILAVCNQEKLPGPLENRAPIINYPFLRYLFEPKRGSAHARNLGLKEAKGTWVQFLDVDDILLPDKIKHQMVQADADVVVSPHVFAFLNGKKVPSAWAPKDIWSALLASELGSTSSMLWKKNTLLQLGGWNTAYYSNQEYELLFRILKAGYSVAAEDTILTMVRERASGSITKTTRHRPLAGIQLREEIWQYLISQGLNTPMRFHSFQKFTFKNLRALYITDAKKALEIHARFFSDSRFKPEIKAIPFYKTMYRLLGFGRTEKFIQHYRYLRDHLFKSWPANV